MTLFGQDFLDARQLSAPRVAAVRRFLDDFEGWLSPRSLDAMSANDLRAFMDSRLAAGYHPNTVRKWLVMARTVASWLYREGAMSATTLLEVREVRAPAGSSAGVEPRPYNRRELRELRQVLDERWPMMPPDEARHYAQRWREGRSPYSRIRRHAIRLQLEAVIALALDLGLRRREIFALDMLWVHYDNEYIVIWGSEGQFTTKPRREVPFTPRSRKAIHEWLRFRELLGVDHDRPWVALQAGPRAGEPMKREAFERLLRTYIGDGWSFKRLRDTCAVAWVKRDLPLEHLRQLLGHGDIKDVLPYARLVGGDLTRRMQQPGCSPDTKAPRVATPRTTS
jgi:site-specific recombinase XerD